jgi:hypothetical protein
MEFNFENFNIQKTNDTATQLSYTASNILAQKNKELQSAFSVQLLKVMMALESFT